MKNSNPTIYIRPVSEKTGFYIAYFSSEVLQATVSLHFKDSIVGAIALNSFVEMLRIKHKFGNYSLQMDTSIQCRNKAVPDVLEIYNDSLAGGAGANTLEQSPEWLTPLRAIFVAELQLTPLTT